MMSRRRLLTTLEIAVPLLLVIAWWLVSAGSENFYFPALSVILEHFEQNWLFERLGDDVWPSLARLAAGFGLAVVIAVPLGLALGLVAPLRRMLASTLEFVRATPPTALVPLAIVLLGVGDTMKVTIIAAISLFPIMLNVVDGVMGIDPVLRDTARAYSIRRRDYLRSVVLPATMPQAFAGARTALALAFIMVVVTEMVAGGSGIGYFVVRSARTFAIADMWSGILLLGILGYVVNGAFTLVERRALRWHRESRASAL